MTRVVLERIIVKEVLNSSRNKEDVPGFVDDGNNI
jgi:hypothetical protein